MFLRAFKINPRYSVSIVNTVISEYSSILRKSPFFEKIPISSQCSVYHYSTGNVKSNGPKKTPSGTKEEFSQEEMDSWQDDPNSFGTISTFATTRSRSGTEPQITSSEQKNNIATKQVNSMKKSMEQYEIDLKELVQRREIMCAVDKFEKNMLLKDKIAAPTRIYEWLISECLHEKETTKAFDLYEHMVNRGLRMSLEIIENLILAYESTDLSLKKVHSLRKSISRMQYQPNAIIYNALIRIYTRTTQWKTGLSIADEMEQQNISFDFETINSIMHACSYDEANGFNRFIKLWHEMRRLRYTPNLQTLNALLKVVHKCELSNIEELKQILASNSDNSTPNKIGINDGRPNILQNPPVLGFLLPLESVKTPADRLLIMGGFSTLITEMKTAAITPDIETLTLLLNVIPNTFFVQQKVIAMLRKYNIVPTLKLFTLLLEKTCLRQDFDNATEVVELISSLGLEIDLVCYGLFAMTCKTASQANEFFAQIGRDPNRLKVEIHIINAMLKNACAANDNNFVISILRKMESECIQPTEETIRMVAAIEKQIFENLRKNHVARKQERNECFKLARECKQWMKHFRIEKERLHLDPNPDGIEDQTEENQKKNPSKRRNIEKSHNFIDMVK